MAWQWNKFSDIKCTIYNDDDNDNDNDNNNIIDNSNNNDNNDIPYIPRVNLYTNPCLPPFYVVHSHRSCPIKLVC